MRHRSDLRVRFIYLCSHKHNTIQDNELISWNLTKIHDNKDHKSLSRQALDSSLSWLSLTKKMGGALQTRVKDN